MKITAKFHVIWVGSKDIPIDYLENLHKLAAIAKESNFELNFLTDRPFAVERMLVSNELRAPNIKIITVNELFEGAKKSDFYNDPSSPNRFKKLEHAVRRELVGATNEAAAADILRLELIRQHGGYYIDMDDKEKQIVGKKFEADDAKHGILLAANDWQDEEALKFAQGCRDFLLELLKNKSIECPALEPQFVHINNTPLAAIPNHPVIEMAIEDGLSYYDKLDEKSEPYQLNKMDQKRRIDSPQRFKETIASMGPSVLQRAVQKYIKQNPEVEPNELTFTRHFNTTMAQKYQASNTFEFKMGNGAIVVKMQCENNWHGSKMHVKLSKNPELEPYHSNHWLVVNNNEQWQLFYPDKATNQYQQVPENIGLDHANSFLNLGKSIKFPLNERLSIGFEFFNKSREDLKPGEKRLAYVTELLKTFILQQIAPFLIDKIDTMPLNPSSFDDSFRFFGSAAKVLPSIMTKPADANEIGFDKNNCPIS